MALVICSWYGNVSSAYCAGGFRLLLLLMLEIFLLMLLLFSKFVLMILILLLSMPFSFLKKCRDFINKIGLAAFFLFIGGSSRMYLSDIFWG